MTRTGLRLRWSILAGLACWCALARPAAAQLSYPMVMSVKPAALQSGTTAELTVQSRYSMAGAYEVQVSGLGVTGEVLLPPPPPDDGKKKPDLTALKVRFTAAADALPGVRDFRIGTPAGVSTVGQLVVVRDPVIVETPNNDRAEQATAATLPAALCGTIEKAEDVDYFRFHVDAGQAFTFHVRSSRLQDRIHDLQNHSDPILTLRTATGTTLAASDNHYFGDPLLSHRFEQAGDYLLEIRDVRYEGNQYWEYCIEAHARPFVETVFPLAVARGQSAPLELVGYQLPAAPMSVACAAPMDMPLGLQTLRIPVGAELTDPVPVVVSDLPLVLEATGDNGAVEKAQVITTPAGVNGRIESEADVDYYVFEAKKGETYSFEVVARRQRSSLDSYLRVVNEKGQQLAANDDARFGRRSHSDSWVENWTAPADGKYGIEVRDVHLRGGAAFPYFLKVQRSQPYFDLFMDTDKTQVAPGACGVIYCRVERKNGFTGPVDLRVDGLPHGVTASCGRILDGKSQDGCIVLEADHDAPLGMANVTIVGTAVHALPDGVELALEARAIPYQEIYLPGGGRGHWPVDAHAVAVMGYGDIRRVELSDYELRMKPGESKTIGVKVERSPGFAANVTLEMVYQHLGSIFGNPLPQGVTIDDKASKTLLAGGATEGQIVLKAAPDAPAVERQQAAVMANVSVNFVMKTTYASRPVMITIERPDPKPMESPASTPPPAAK
ncbi:MAG: hypothetical protein U0939_01980 [Pirellulales bacterium]